MYRDETGGRGGGEDIHSSEDKQAQQSPERILANPRLEKHGHGHAEDDGIQQHVDGSVGLVRRDKGLDLERAVGVPGGRLGQVPVGVDGDGRDPGEEAVGHAPERREDADEHGGEPQARAALVDAEELEEEGQLDEGGRAGVCRVGEPEELLYICKCQPSGCSRGI